MVRELIGLWGAAAERCRRDWPLGAVTATVAALFAAVSLGFATVASYSHLRASEGPVAAALIVCAVYSGGGYYGGDYAQHDYGRRVLHY